MILAGSIIGLRAIVAVMHPIVARDDFARRHLLADAPLKALKCWIGRGRREHGRTEASGAGSLHSVVLLEQADLPLSVELRNHLLHCCIAQSRSEQSRLGCRRRSLFC